MFNICAILIATSYVAVGVIPPSGWSNGFEEHLQRLGNPKCLKTTAVSGRFRR